MGTEAAGHMGGEARGPALELALSRIAGIVMQMQAEAGALIEDTAGPAAPGTSPSQHRLATEETLLRNDGRSGGASPPSLEVRVGRLQLGLLHDPARARGGLLASACGPCESMGGGGMSLFMLGGWGGSFRCGGRGEERMVARLARLQASAYPSPTTHRPPPIAHHPSPNTHHPTPNTQHPSPNTQHPSPNTYRTTRATYRTTRATSCATAHHPSPTTHRPPPATVPALWPSCVCHVAPPPLQVTERYLAYASPLHGCPSATLSTTAAASASSPPLLLAATDPSLVHPFHSTPPPPWVPYDPTHGLLECSAEQLEPHAAPPHAADSAAADRQVGASADLAGAGAPPSLFSDQLASALPIAWRRLAPSAEGAASASYGRSHAQLLLSFSHPAQAVWPTATAGMPPTATAAGVRGRGVQGGAAAAPSDHLSVSKDRHGIDVHISRPCLALNVGCHPPLSTTPPPHAGHLCPKPTTTLARALSSTLLPSSCRPLRPLRPAPSPSPFTLTLTAHPHFSPHRSLCPLPRPQPCPHLHPRLNLALTSHLSPFTVHPPLRPLALGAAGDALKG